jgi:transcriptional regulator with XRE-family HTH domain
MRVSSDFGAKIRQRRLELGLSLEQAARKAQIPSSTIRTWEKSPFGKNGPGARLVAMLAGALECRMDELTGLQEGDLWIDGRTIDNDELRRSISKALKRRMDFDGLSQEELANAMGMTRQAVHSALGRGAIPLLMTAIDHAGYELQIRCVQKGKA